MQPLDLLPFVVVGFAGWLNQHQQNIIDYLMERIVYYATNWEASACD